MTIDDAVATEATQVIADFVSVARSGWRSAAKPQGPIFRRAEAVLALLHAAGIVTAPPPRTGWR